MSMSYLFSACCSCLLQVLRNGSESFCHPNWKKKKIAQNIHRGQRHLFVRPVCGHGYVCVTNTSWVSETPEAHPARPAGTPRGPSHAAWKTPVNLCLSVFVLLFSFPFFNPCFTPPHCKPVQPPARVFLLHLSHVGRGRINGAGGGANNYLGSSLSKAETHISAKCWQCEDNVNIAHNYNLFYTRP